MKDETKREEKLGQKLAALRQRVAELEAVELEHQQAEAALQDSEKQFHQIFNHSNDAIFILDPPRDEILDVNPKASSMLEYSREELLSLPISAIHPQEMPKFLAFYQTVSEQGQGWTDQLTCLTKSNQVLPAEISASVIDIGGRTCMIALVRDISQRKQVEAALQRTSEELELRVVERTAELSKTIALLEEQITERERAEETLQQYAERLQIQHEIDQGILAADSPEAIAQAAIAHIRELVPCQRASVILFDWQKQTGTVLAAHTSQESRVQAKTLLPLQGFPDLESLQQGQVRVVKEMRTLPHPMPGDQALAREGIRSFINVPLLVQDQLIGTFNLGATVPNAFSDEHIEIACEVANSLAVAIQNARLFEAEALRRQEAEALRDIAGTLSSTLNLEEVLERILTNIERVVPYDAANIMLVESGVARIVRYRGYAERGWEEAIKALHRTVAKTWNLRHMAETGQPLAISDVLVEDKTWDVGWVRSFAGAPIYLKEEIIGFLNLDSETPGFYKPIHAERLQAFAAQAAVAIENARLYESERHQRQIAEILLETSTAVTSTLDVGQVLLRLASQLREISGFHRCIIYGWEPHSKSVYEVAEHARTIHLVEGGKAYPLARYPTIERVLTSGQPEISSVGLAEVEEAELTLMRSIGMTTLMTLPLYSQEQTIGLVEIGDTSATRVFDQTTVARCQQILQEAALWLNTPLLANSVEKLLALAKRLVNSSAGCLCILSTWYPEAGTVRTAAEYNDATWPLGKGPAFALADYPVLAQALDQDKSVVVWPSLSPNDETTSKQAAKWGERTLVVHPLSVKGKTIGLAELLHFTGKRTLSQEELRLWRAMTDQATIALENARLYESLQEQMQALRETQAQLIHSEKMAALGRMMASIAHEINNPLQSVQSCLTLTREELDDRQRPEKLDRYLGVVESEIDRVAIIIHRLRDFYRPVRQEMQPIDLHTVLEDVLALVGKQLQQNGVSVERSWSGNLPLVEANADHLQQVFLNLILNALDAMPNGGTLHLVTELEQRQVGPGQSTLPVVRIELGDTGEGMSPETLAHLFEPFFTTKGTGSGLGLSISYGIIEAHHGQISVTSQVGLGTTFTILLPVAQSGEVGSDLL